MSTLYKYPRTYHFSWSPGLVNDDRVIESLDAFQGRRVIASNKVDGENCNLYSDAIHARSLDSKHHDSRNWVKSFWGGIKHQIPEGWRICGENLYAKHSIYYDNLPSYFMGFSVWDEENYCLSWDDTLTFFEKLSIIPVQTIFDGVFNEEKLKSLVDADILNGQEGFVVRTADGFNYKDFSKRVVKYVRKGHVQTSTHWSTEKIIPNKLKQS